MQVVRYERDAISKHFIRSAPMKTRIRWFHVVDWRSISITVGILAPIALVIAIFFSPQILHSYRLMSYKGETKGNLTTVKENTTQRQTRYGTKIVVESYTITYRYVVNGRPIFSTEVIDGNGKNTFHLRKILENDLTIPVTIKYDANNPKRSIVVFD